MEKTDLYSIVHRLQAGKWVCAGEVETLKDYILNNDLRQFANCHLRFCLKPFRASSLISTFPFEHYEFTILENVLKKQEKERKASAAAVRGMSSQPSPTDNESACESEAAVRWDNFSFKQHLYTAESRLQHGEYADLTEIEREVFGKFIRFSYEALDIIRDFEIIGMYLSEKPEPKEARETDKIDLPAELDTPRARKYFDIALEAHFIAKTTKGYKWTLKVGRGSLAQLAYFCSRIYCPGAMGSFPEAALNTLFGVSRLGSALSQVFNAKTPQGWRSTIDGLFED